MRSSAVHFAVGLFLIAPFAWGDETELREDVAWAADSTGFWNGSSPGTLALTFGARKTLLGEDAYGTLQLTWPLDGMVRTKSWSRASRGPDCERGSGATDVSDLELDVLEEGPPRRPSREPPVALKIVEQVEIAAADVDGGVPASSTEAASGSEEEQSAVAKEPTLALTTPRVPKRLLRILIALVEERARGKSGLVELAGLAQRARWSGVMPELRLRGAHGLDQTVSPATSGIYGAEPLTKGGWDTAVEARLTFHLDRLVYDDAEQSLARQAAQEREYIEKKVATAFNEFLEYWALGERLLRSDLDEEERLALELKHAIAEARLEEATGGKFAALLQTDAPKSEKSAVPSAGTPKSAPPPEQQ